MALSPDLLARLDKYVYRPDSPYHITGDPQFDAELRKRLSRVEDPDVRLRILLEQLKEVEPQSRVAGDLYHNIVSLPEMPGPWSARTRALLQGATGGLVGSDRVDLPSEDIYSTRGMVTNQLMPYMAGTMATMMFGAPAAAGALMRLSPVLRKSPQLAYNLVMGARDATQAAVDTGVYGRLRRGYEQFQGSPLPAPSTPEIVANIALQGLLGGAGAGLQSRVSRWLGWDPRKALLSPHNLIRNIPGAGLNTALQVGGGLVQHGALSWDERSMLDPDLYAPLLRDPELRKILGAQLAFGLGMGLTSRPMGMAPGPRKPAGLPPPGEQDVTRRLFPVHEVVWEGITPSPNAPRQQVAIDPEVFIAEALSAALRGLSEEDAVKQALRKAARANQFVDLIDESGARVGYSGELRPVPGMESLLREGRRIIGAGRLGRVSDIESSPRAFRPDRSTDKELIIPPGWTLFPEVESKGRGLNAVVLVPDESNPRIPHEVHGGVVLGTNPYGEALVWFPKDNRLIKAPTTQVILPEHSRQGRGITVFEWLNLKREERQARRAAMAEASRTRPPRKLDELRQLGSEDPLASLAAFLEKLMKQRSPMEPVDRASSTAQGRNRGDLQ